MKNARIIAISTHKGGAAKTQTTFEFAVWLSKNGHHVCVVDTDSQANITDLLLAGALPKGRCLPEIIFDSRGISKVDIMSRDFGKGINVDFVCSNANVARLEARIPSNVVFKEFIMADLLEQLKASYDYILIDTPPASELLSLSSLVAANDVIIPALPDILSLEGIRSTLRMVTAIQSNSRFASSPRVLGIIIGRYHHTRTNKELIEQLKKEFGELVVNPQIRECTKVQQAIRAKLPVLLYDSTCSAASDFENAFNNLKLD